MDKFLEKPIISFDKIMNMCTPFDLDGELNITIKYSDFKNIIREFISHFDIDEKLYLDRHRSIAEGVKSGDISSAKAHWNWHGYFEGRLLIGWEGLDFTTHEIRNANSKYFSDLKSALYSNFIGKYHEAEILYKSSISQFDDCNAARLAIAQFYILTKRPLDAEKFLLDILKINPTCKLAIEILGKIYLEFKQENLFFKYTELNINNNVTVQYCQELFKSGSYRKTSNLLVNALGDKFTKITLQAEVKEKINNIIYNFKDKNDNFLSDKSTLTHMCLLSLNLAHLGFFNKSFNLLRDIESIISNNENRNIISQKSFYCLIKSSEIRTGVRNTLSLLNKYIYLFKNNQFFDELKIKYLYQLNDTSGVLRFVRELTYHTISNDILEIYGFSLLKENLLDEALKLCRENWKYSFTERWVISLSFMISRSMNRYCGTDIFFSGAISPSGVIPTHIVQFWDKNEPPTDVITLMSKWKSMPGFSYELFSDSLAKNFISEFLGDSYLKLYEHCYHPAMKSDFFRLMYLYINGGIYIDADERCVGHLSDLFDSNPTKDLFVSLTSDGFFVNNAFIAVTPRHYVIEKVLSEVIKSIENTIRSGEKPSVWDVTGPRQLSYVMAELMISDDESMTEILANAAFLYPHSLDKFTDTIKLDYKETEDGNWRAKKHRMPELLS